MFEIQINKNKPIVLIDCSYYIFHRYFATLKWFSFQKLEINNNMTENTEFIKAFLKHFNNDMKKISKKWKTDNNNIILCMDCPRSKIWRNDIYPEYKATRVQNEKFDSNIFKIFNEYINNNSSLKRIFFERLEADDIIYLIQSKIKSIYNEKNIDQKIIIITNDNDYLQLSDVNIIINNMQMKDITLRGVNNAKHDLIIKALIGDKSDNIPKISSLITKEKAIKLAELDEEERLNYLIENNLLDKFNYNMTLISFDNIPNEIIDSFYNNINFILF